MNREELDREFDEWLDRASAEYGRAETRPGFEARVIANVNSRLEKRRWRFRWASMATATAAILVISSYVLLTRFQEHAEIESVLEELQQPKLNLPKSARPEQPPSTVRAESSTRREAGKQAHPKAGESEKTSFLSAKLSDQERYLISFVQAVSAQTSTSIPETGSGPPQMPDLEIPKLQIPQAQISSFKIEMVELPTGHQNEDQL